MRNIFITQGVYKDKYNSAYFKTDMNWIVYAKKHKFNLIQINNPNFLEKNKNIDGIIFTGGNDLSKFKKSKENLFRDKMEKKILHLAKKKKIPCLFICRGMQLLADVEKLRIIKDLKKMHVGKNHEIYIEDKKIVVNSFHNFIIKTINKNFKLIGVCKKDNSVEIMKHYKKELLAFMFHPERYSPDQKKIDKIFRNFFKL